MICDLALTSSSGVFNYSDGEVMTRFHFALRAAKALGKSYKHITAKTDPPTVIRPHDCSMLSGKEVKIGVIKDHNFDQFFFFAKKNIFLLP